MSETPSNDAEAAEDDGGRKAELEKRIFLVVVDDTEEMSVALRFACGRARHTGGRVALLYVLEPNDYQHWMAVGKLMREEARAEAEKLLQRQAGYVQSWAGTMPILFLREGSRHEALMELIEEEPSISILVLGASTGQGGPGPLVSALTGKLMGKLRVPITVVPGNLSESEIDSIS